MWENMNNICIDQMTNDQLSKQFIHHNLDSVTLTYAPHVAALHDLLKAVHIAYNSCPGQASCRNARTSSQQRPKLVHRQWSSN